MKFLSCNFIAGNMKFLLLLVFSYCLTCAFALHVTVVAGTHYSQNPPQITKSEVCGSLERALFNEWKQFGSENVPGRVLFPSLEQVRQVSNDCTLGLGIQKWSFPLDSPDCLDAKMSNFRKLSGLGFLTPHLVPAFQKLHGLGISTEFVIFWGSDPESMFAYQNSICLSKMSFTSRQIQRMHRMMTNMLLFQTYILIHRHHVSVRWITSSKEQTRFIKERDADFCVWNTSSNQRLVSHEQIPQILSFSRSPVEFYIISPNNLCNEIVMTLNALKHAQLTENGLKSDPRPKKRMLFIAGLEGTGHHLFQKYIGVLAKSNYLCLNNEVTTAIQIYLSSPDIDKLENNEKKLCLMLEKLEASCANKPFLINTYFGSMMMSYPYGEDWTAQLYCKLPIRGRQCLTVPDIISLYNVLKRLNIHLDVLFLIRPLGASIVSTAIHRQFQPVVTQSAVLASSLQELIVQMSLVSSFRDGISITSLNFYDLYSNPQSSNDLLLSFFGVDMSSFHGTAMIQYINKLSARYPNITSNSWIKQLAPQVYEPVNSMFGYIDIDLIK